MKIGIFGGTFNPVHNGHLINARAVKEQIHLDKIIFIPSKYPVHKEPDELASAEDRYNMLVLAVGGNQDFEASRIEIDRGGDSYFIITYKQLKSDHIRDDLFVIIGADAFKDIFKWKDHKKLLQLTKFIIIKRPGSDINYIENNEFKNIKEIIQFENPLIDISSSSVRENVRNRKPISGLVPPKVNKYIIDKGLYSV